MSAVPQRCRDAGLTLIEVLVGLALFSIISLAGLGLLEGILRIAERSDTRLERLAELDRAFLLIRRDIAQVGPSGFVLEDNAVRYVLPWRDGTVPIILQHVDETLQRAVGAEGAKGTPQDLISHVRSIRWEALDRGGAWQARWSINSDSPAALRLTLELPAPGTREPAIVTRLFPTPRAAALP